MARYRRIARFNARVLDERTPPGYHQALEGAGEPGSSPLPEGGLRLAFSREAAPMLEAVSIECAKGAGGVEAWLTTAGLERLRGLSMEAAGDLGTAVEEACRGWARNRYLWKVKGDGSIPLGGRPRLMGVLNVTPDSFSDGGLHASEDAAWRHAAAMVEAGADLIDVGGESTRPGSDPVDAAEEIRRTVPVIRAVSERTGIPVSIDTTKAEVAEAALEAGASIINDISGMTFDPGMARLAARTRAGVVLMHIQGRPKDMQHDPRYGDTVAEVSMILRERVLAALEAGVVPERIVLDPGIGFGKRFEDNLRLLGSVGEMRSLGFPLLFGSSRKSLLGRISGQEPAKRALETAAASVVAALSGVQILRVHDIEENLRCIKVAEAILEKGRRGAGLDF
jgi:dihydropteroate synthase